MSSNLTSIAVESAKRAARAGLNGCANPLERALVLSALHNTLSDEAKSAGADLVTRLDGLTRAIATAAYDACGEHPDAARLLVKNSGLLAAAQLNVLLAVKPPRQTTGAQP